MMILLNHVSFFLALLLVFILCVPEFKALSESESSSELFRPPAAIKVAAPTMFVKPTHMFRENHNGNNNNNITVVVEPTFGKHRSNVDAVFAYAEGYVIEEYRFFLETLVDSGFDGDVVLAISEERMVKPMVVDYLKSYSEEFEKKSRDGDGKGLLNVVVYMPALQCYDRETKARVQRGKAKNGELDKVQLCYFDHMYGYRDPTSGKVLKSLLDVRGPRVVATLRYEWYWVWSLRYDPHSWLLLLDARDAYFQSNPFLNLPRTTTTTRTTNNHQQDNGYLYFYGENHETTRLGKSQQNRNWITIGYGDYTMSALFEKPTICSGSTMGEQIAIETYLRAMVGEWDETDVHLMGSDQGFHNYLYYSSKLVNARTIRAIIVWEQGKGHVNNLGALRTKPLTEWGIYHPQNASGVYQWDNRTLSPVVHQWDRDKELNTYIHRKRMRPLKSWEKKT